MTHSLAKSLQCGEVSIGSWLQLPSTDTAELMSQMGYDWLVIDMEHGSIDISQLPDLCRALASGAVQHRQEQKSRMMAQCNNTMAYSKETDSSSLQLLNTETSDFLAPMTPLPLVRVPAAEKMFIRRALDAGAAGLIFPMMQSRAELDAAIDVALYPHPSKHYGSRGVGYAPANAYGKRFHSYKKNTAQDLVFIAQIEHIDALEELEAMVTHPHLHAIMVGPYDLSASLGIMGQFEHPLFVQALQEIQDICRKHHMTMGTHVISPNPAHVQEAIDKGYTFIAYGIDAVFLWQHASRPNYTVQKDI